MLSTLLVSLLGTGAVAGDFLSEQMRFPRVREAFKTAAPELKAAFQKEGLSYPPREVFFRAFKSGEGAGAGVLELWARGGGSGSFSLVKTYPVCAASGVLGPKRMKDDLQVPEGFYFVDRFNPQSKFHLSLALDYPNASDRILGVRERLGGDIFVHGACVSIGCLAMTDGASAEIYAAAVLARDAGQTRIPVHVFPFRFGGGASEPQRPEFSAFWANLRRGYELFEAARVPPKFTVDSLGGYVFRE